MDPPPEIWFRYRERCYPRMHSESVHGEPVLSYRLALTRRAGTEGKGGVWLQPSAVRRENRCHRGALLSVRGRGPGPGRGGGRVSHCTWPQAPGTPCYQASGVTVPLYVNIIPTSKAGWSLRPCHSEHARARLIRKLSRVGPG